MSQTMWIGFGLIVFITGCWAYAATPVVYDRLEQELALKLIAHPGYSFLEDLDKGELHRALYAEYEIHCKYDDFITYEDYLLVCIRQGHLDIRSIFRKQTK